MEDFSCIHNKRIYTISITAIIFVLLFSVTTFLIVKNALSIKEQPSNTDNVKTINLSTIKKPNYNIPKISPDTNLEILPSDYDKIVKTFDTSLTQHQKMSLLIYGETESKSNLQSVKEGYFELIEKDIPILIPEQYLKIYIDQQLDKYISQLNKIPNQLIETQCMISPTFNNPYQKYIWEEMIKIEQKEQLRQDTTNQNEQISISNFLLDFSSELVNESLYKIRIINALSEGIDTTPVGTFINNLIIYSQNKDDLNAKAQITRELAKLIFNTNITNSENIYWRISVINGTSYVYPVPLSKEFPVDDNNFSIEYDVAPTEQSRNSVRVPILMLHRIEPMPTNASSFVQGLYITPETFEKQLAYLVKKNYKTLTSQEFYDLLSTGNNPSQKSIMLTFDDSTYGQYTNGFPLLKKYGLTGIFYIPSNKTTISYDQLREMAREGMIIESHSATHIDLAKENSPERLYSEIVGSRNTLKSVTGQPVITISYPGCVADSQAYPYVSQAGYLLGTSCGKSIDHYFKKRLSLSRVHVFNDMEDFKNLLSGKR